MAKAHGINRNDANEEIRKFLEFREEFTKPEVLALLSEKAANFLQSETLSFGFDKEQIEALFTEVTGGNAYRIYFAADTATGEPTLVILPCVIDFDLSEVANKLALNSDPGKQYPYTFRRGGNKSNFDEAFDIANE